MLILLAGPNGAEEAGSWAVRETFVAVVVSNVPILYSIVRGFVKSISEYHTKRFEIKSSENVRMNNVSGSLNRNRRSGRSRDLGLAYPNDSGSLEHIVQEGDLESKSDWHEHTKSQASGRPSFGTRDADNRPARITVATRMTVESEPAPELPVKGSRDVGELY